MEGKTSQDLIENQELTWNFLGMVGNCDSILFSNSVSIHSSVHSPIILLHQSLLLKQGAMSLPTWM